MPGKEDNVVFCKLTEFQEKIYNRGSVATGLGRQKKTPLFTNFTEYEKIKKKNPYNRLVFTCFHLFSLVFICFHLFSLVYLPMSLLSSVEFA